MTPLERDEWKKLVKEKKDKIAESQREGDDTAVWVTRRGKVVNVSRHANLRLKQAAAEEAQS